MTDKIIDEDGGDVQSREEDEGALAHPSGSKRK